MAFDLLALDGEPTLRILYSERHALLEELILGTPSGAEMVGSFEDGPALWAAIVARGLEGVVAKARAGGAAARGAAVGEDEEPCECRGPGSLRRVPEYRVLLLNPEPSYYGDYTWTYDGETPDPGQTITITTVTAGPDSEKAKVTSVDDDDPKTIVAEHLSG